MMKDTEIAAFEANNAVLYSLDRLGEDRRDLTLTEEDLAGGRCRRLRGFVGGALRTGSDG